MVAELGGANLLIHRSQENVLVLPVKGAYRLGKGDRTALFNSQVAN